MKRMPITPTFADLDPRPELAWYSVQTPNVFEEYQLPTDQASHTPEQRWQWRRLERLAERHGTHIAPSGYQRG